MSVTLLVVLVVVGLLFLLLEILVIPGIGVSGVIGLAIMSYAVWRAYVTMGSVCGHITLASVLAISTVALIFALRANTWKRVSLNTEIDSKVNVIKENVKAGDIGKTVSRIAPSGKAIINGEYYEVHTYGDFINENTDVEIIKIEHNKIFIKLKQN